MTTSLRTTTIFCAFVALVAFAGLARAAEAVTPQAQANVKVLDEMGVESKWLAGERVHWDTGLPTGVPETSPGKHTHCSAFVGRRQESRRLHFAPAGARPKATGE